MRKASLLVMAMTISMVVLVPSSQAVTYVNPPSSVEVVQTSADLSQQLTRLPDLAFTTLLAPGLPAITIDDHTRYQRIIGFGAAMTDSSAWLLENGLPASVSQAAMAGLFAQAGLHLNFLRVPIGASDFTKDGRPYSYDDMLSGRSDPRLARFSIVHDTAYVLPALRQAHQLNPRLELLATPWSPPAWMKFNHSLSNLDHHGRLLGSAAGAWAKYFVKFLQAYAAAGVPVTAISLQNEPGNPTDYPGLELPERQAGALMARRLLPALRSAHLHPKIYAGELGWGSAAGAYASAVVGDRNFRGLSGIAWHCYSGTPYLMGKIEAIAPRLDQIVSECSPGLFPFPVSEAVIASMRNWASAVDLWNVALDPSGGPVQAPNTGCRRCTALLTVDPTSGTVTPTLSYFQLGQVSHFVKRGAYRIDSDHLIEYGYPKAGVNIAGSGLDDVAFQNPDRSIVLVAYANSSSPISFAVRYHGVFFDYTLPAGATVTFKWHP